MENIFPLQESVEIEEIYGSKRPNSHPPSHSKTFNMNNKMQKSTDTVSYQVRMLDWFNVGELSQIERVSMNDTIQSIGENMYMKTRNKIIDAYEKGERPMTITTALRLVDVDLVSLLQVFSFAEKWGLINYKSLLDKELKCLELCKTPCEEKDSVVKPKDTSETPVDLKAHLERCVCDCGGKAAFFTSSLLFRCSDCFNRGVYPPEISQADFFHVSESLIKNMWSRKEELLLMEGIVKFGDQWNLVSQYVQTKTKDQCAFHFLRMPILENTFSKAGFSVGLPFETAENPIMCLVAFICGIVHPAVASECAKTAMKYVDGNPQEVVVHRMLDAARVKATEQMKLEKMKIQRLENVMCEAMLNKIRLKMESYKDLHLSVERIRDELVTLKQSLIEELNFADESSEEN